MYHLQIAYTSTEEELVKHVQQSHGMPRLHRFLYDVYEYGTEEGSAEILSPGHEAIPVYGKSVEELGSASGTYPP